ncbi:energy transducer TonB [Luteimonas vadosa]|uniref:Protein TonB n=1 Tax=Luteimonas vadosa TaxID=1165507 RepID=A0ABP9E116_9GAMM
MTDPTHREDARGHGNEPKQGFNPLLLILVLIALLAFGWYWFNQRGSVEPASAPDDIPAVDIGSARETAAETERATAKASRPAVPADRDAYAVARLQPSYPPTAFRAGEEGTVIVRVDVDAQGNVTAVDVARRSDSRELDREAVNAVREWTFEPAIRGGKPVASTVQVPIEFKLDAQ